LDNSLNAQLGIGGPFLQQFYATSFPAGFGFFPSLFALQFQRISPADEFALEGELHRMIYLHGLSIIFAIAVILCLLFF
jgi:hypothetical protein